MHVYNKKFINIVVFNVKVSNKIIDALNINLSDLQEI